MDPGSIAEVRRFNRTVTQELGVLHDHFRQRSRPLGEARVLWEIGPDGADVRTLRARLDLDSGYLSRVLRALEGAGLVVVGTNPDDKRVRTARLTRAGRRERALLDARSDELAASFLEPLDAPQQARLVAAMRDVERLLTARLVQIDETDPEEPDARHCIDAYFAELHARFDTGFDPALSISADADELRAPAGLLLVARLRSEPIGCGALKFHRRAPTEIKRMWVSPSARGLGVGRKLLDALERHARERGSRTVRLETNRSLTEAIAMYRATGYVEVDAFNAEPYAHHWFEKRLSRADR